MSQNPRPLLRAPKRTRHDGTGALEHSKRARSRGADQRASRQTSLAPFQHQPLEPDTSSIRLIEVLDPSLDGSIRCRMRHVKRSNALNGFSRLPPAPTSYTCLSYVWGSPLDIRWITLNDKQYQIRKNLWDVLNVISTLRQRVSNRGIPFDTHCVALDMCSQSLWIDALCIDQDNVTERNEQVQKMGAIYSEADQVVAWLGNDFTIASLFSWVRDCARPSHQPDFDDIMSQRSALNAITGNAYWTRAWITQEVLSARKTFLLACTESVAMEDLQDRVESVKISYGYDFYEQLWRPVARMKRPETPQTLLENMQAFKHKQCSQRRDLAYSLRSISVDGTKLLVNYNQSIGMLSRAILQMYERHLCLCHMITVLNVLDVRQTLDESLESDSKLPLVETGASYLPRSAKYCDVCRSDLKAGTLSEFFARREGAMHIICLECTHHKAANTEEENHKELGYGHMAILSEDHGYSQLIYWAPTGGTWVMLTGFVTTQDRAIKTRRHAVLSLGLVCELIQLIPMESVPVTHIAPGGIGRQTRWKVSNACENLVAVPKIPERPREQKNSPKPTWAPEFTKDDFFMGGLMEDYVQPSVAVEDFQFYDPDDMVGKFPSGRSPGLDLTFLDD